jgi:hypothetical protein
VYPGYFKTNFLLKDSLRLAAYPLPAYEEARTLEVIHAEQISGNQPGDPENAASVLIQVAENDYRPLHLFLGTDAYTMAKNKIETLQSELDTYESLGKSTDFKK